MKIRREYKENAWDILTKLNKDLEKIVPRYIYRERRTLSGKIKKSRTGENWDTNPYYYGDLVVYLYNSSYESEFIKVCKKYGDWIEYLYIENKI